MGGVIIKAPCPWKSLHASAHCFLLRARRCTSTRHGVFQVRAPFPPRLSRSSPCQPCPCLRASVLTIPCLNTLPHVPICLISSLPSGLCSKVTFAEKASLHPSLLLADHSHLLHGLCFPKVCSNLSYPTRSFSSPFKMGGREAPVADLTNMVEVTLTLKLPHSLCFLLLGILAFGELLPEPSC